MKKIVLLLVAMLMTTSTFAQHSYNHRGYSHGGHWVLPFIVGGTLVYAATRNNAEPIPRTTTVIVQQPMPTVVIDSTNVPPPQPVYTEYTQYDANCNCYVKIMRQTGWR